MSISHITTILTETYITLITMECLDNQAPSIRRSGEPMDKLQQKKPNKNKQKKPNKKNHQEKI